MIDKYGWGGIRTHGAFTHASFQDWYLKPLDHPSILTKPYVSWVVDIHYVVMV